MYINTYNVTKQNNNILSYHFHTIISPKLKNNTNTTITITIPNKSNNTIITIRNTITNKPTTKITQITPNNPQTLILFKHNQKLNSSIESHTLHINSTTPIHILQLKPYKKKTIITKNKHIVLPNSTLNKQYIILN